jgi:hypothetical protein
VGSGWRLFVASFVLVAIAAVLRGLTHHPGYGSSPLGLVGVLVFVALVAWARPGLGAVLVGLLAAIGVVTSAIGLVVRTDFTLNEDVAAVLDVVAAVAAYRSWQAFRATEREALNATKE